jgi:hypothetical protein
MPETESLGNEEAFCEAHPCMDCGEIANLHFAHISRDEVRTERHLCESCAAKRVNLRAALFDDWPEPRR